MEGLQVKSLDSNRLLLGEIEGSHHDDGVARNPGMAGSVLASR